MFSQKSEDPNDDEMYNYDYSIELNPAGTVPGTAAGMGYGGKPMSSLGAQGRMMTGQAGRMGTGMLASRAGPGTSAGGGGGEVRPMTSVQGVGYQGKSANREFNPLNQAVAPTLVAKQDNSPEDYAKEMEKQVNGLIEVSADKCMKGDFSGSLDEAKEAAKRERSLCKYRESNGLVDQINIDLTYAVCFNLANAYHKNKMYEEALHTYNLLVKNKQYPQSGRLRVNMGNIHYEQKKYPMAIKMYRMALDQIPNTGKEIRFKIFRNIGNAFVRLGQFQDAIQSYETIMGGSPDFQTGFNLILCYYALGDADKMKRWFQKLLQIPIQGMGEDDEEPEETKAAEDAEAVGHARKDGLREELKRRQKEATHYVFTAARLITPALDPREWAQGYRWAIDTLKPDHESVASELEMEMALRYLKSKNFEKAIEVLKSFEKKDQEHKAMAATNLSFIYFLEQDIDQAEKYADMAYTHDRYNAKALVNKGNCLMMSRKNENVEMAKQFYLEAIGVEADCVEAIYNLGLVNLKMGSFAEAQQAFEKLHTVIPQNPEVIYQIANLYEQNNDLSSAIEWFKILNIQVPSDPGVLARMGQIYNKQDDEAQAFHNHLESYRHYPVSLDVISWLGVWYVKSELYEKAIHFFERASQIQPDEVKWRLMVTSCYRRMQNFQKALELYERIHADHPDNVECLRYLVAICKDLGRPYDIYQQKLSRLDSRDRGQTRGPLTRSGESDMGGLRGPGGGMGGGGRGGALGRVSEDDGPRAPMARAPADRPNQRAKAADAEDDDFNDADVADMLPGL